MMSGATLLRVCLRSVCLLLLTQTATSTQQTQDATAKIGILLDLHRDGSGAANCSRLNLPQVQHYLAAEWAAQVINNQSQSQGIQIGVDLYDTCGNRDVAMRDVFFALRGALDQRNKKPLLGLIGLGDPEVMSESLATLHAFNVPLILASPRLAEMVTQHGNILTSAPDISGVISPMVSLARELSVRYVSIVSTCIQSVSKFSRAAASLGIRIDRKLQLQRSSPAMGEVLKRFLDDSTSNETICFILESTDIDILGEYLRSYKRTGNNLIIGAIGFNKNLIQLWKHLFAGSYLIEPHMPELPDFRSYLLSRMQAAQVEPDHLIGSYMEAFYDCQWISSSSPKTNCRHLSKEILAQKLQIDPEVNFVVKAVSAYSAALLLHCVSKTSDNCLHPEPNAVNLQQAILSTLTQLSFTSNNDMPFELQGTSHHVSYQGQLIPNKYVIYSVGSDGDVSKVGWYSDDQGLTLDYSVTTTPHMTQRQSQNKLEYGSRKTLYELNSPSSEGVKARRIAHESSLTRPWATVIVAVTAIGIFITLFILIYVLLKICDGSLSGNQSMGLILLFGIIILYASVVFYVMPSNGWKCLVRTFLHPLALSLCYGILIIKVMQLRSLVLLGLGGRVSYVNQYILLFFIVLVQVVISVQWFLSNNSRFHLDTCYMSPAEFILLHMYILLLGTITFIYGLTVLKIKRNYKEGHWITLAAFLCIPVLVVCGLVITLAQSWLYEPTMCVTLLSLASILVLVIFIPKLNTISKQCSHFKHKKFPMANSIATVFTTYTEDLQNNSQHLGSEYFKKKLKSSNGGQSSMVSANGTSLYPITSGLYSYQ